MTAGSPRNSARSWLPLLPAVVLLLVAAGQVYLATRGSLTPWKGGGFGMFSTNDRPDSRRVRAWVSGAGGSEEIEISADLANLSNKARFLPRSDWLVKLGRAVAAEAAEEGGKPSSVRIGVWRRQYDRESLEMQWVPLEEVVLEVADRAQ